MDRSGFQWGLGLRVVGLVGGLEFRVDSFGF